MSSTASQKISPNASPSEGAPEIPWPLKPGRTYCVEVCRWYHEPTERRNGWHWIYEVCIGVEGDELLRAAFVSFRARRLHHDVINGCRYGTESVGDYGGVEVSNAELRAKLPPPRLTQFFADAVEKVRRRAAKHEGFHERAAEYGGDW